MKKYLPLSLLILLLTACGGNQAAAPTPTAQPTRTSIPTYSYVSPTPAIVLPTTAPTQAAQGDNAQAIEQGRGRYEALDCGSCHGANGEGNGDEGPTVIGMTMSEPEFVTLLRSGGKLGSKHQYATNRLSDRGAHNLYLYLISLAS